ncbi:H-NS histone family protein [Eleftheria terrae]|uniref:H-NS histone family protein n=1 Tax=Eleftheria terrae TaxID=1597781 RepID=UPI00263B9C4D|nr:H-NS histone family protein [Eleftheria terrae]WKB56184.1 H-NS histone family protein [Eleftheria terrae]
MPKTYAQLQAQMEVLQRRMEEAKRKEAAPRLAQIRADVAAYGFTVEDVFGAAKPHQAKRAARRAADTGAAKYRDAAGNTWSGRGPRPRWLRDAIAQGADLASFLAVAERSQRTTAVDAEMSGEAPSRPKRAAAKKRAVPAKKAKAAAAKRDSGARPDRERGKVAAKKAKPKAAATRDTPARSRRRSLTPPAAGGADMPRPGRDDTEPGAAG